MKRMARLALPAVLLLCAVAGCNDRNVATCDITQRACQVDIYYRVLNLRGDGYDPFGGLPPVTVITEDQYRAELEAAAAEDAAKNGPNPWDKGLELLHFTTGPVAPAPDGGAGADGGAGSDAGNSAIDDQVAHTYAEYFPETKTVRVIAHRDSGSALALDWSMVVLAHELVHALQDRELDLQNLGFRWLDELLANRAMTEGDARFYDYLFTANVFPADVQRKLGGLSDDPADWPDEELDWIYANFDQGGSPFYAGMYLRYPLGARYEANAYRSGGNAAVRHAYADMPIRTVGFLLDDAGRSPPVGTGDVCSPPYVPALPIDDPKTVGGNQFGAMLFYAFLRGWGVEHATAYATAQTWTGDFLLIQANADFTTTAVTWRLEFSAAVPASVGAALTASGELSVKTGAKSLEITTTDSAIPLVWEPSDNCP
jgi:hypothetical protein